VSLLPNDNVTFNVTQGPQSSSSGLGTLGPGIRLSHRFRLRPGVSVSLHSPNSSSLEKVLEEVDDDHLRSLLANPLLFDEDFDSSDSSESDESGDLGDERDERGNEDESLEGNEPADKPADKPAGSQSINQLLGKSSEAKQKTKSNEDSNHEGNVGNKEVVQKSSVSGSKPEGKKVVVVEKSDRSGSLEEKSSEKIPEKSSEKVVEVGKSELKVVEEKPGKVDRSREKKSGKTSEKSNKSLKSRSKSELVHQIIVDLPASQLGHFLDQMGSDSIAGVKSNSEVDSGVDTSGNNKVDPGVDNGKVDNGNNKVDPQPGVANFASQNRIGGQIMQRGNGNGTGEEHQDNGTGEQHQDNGTGEQHQDNGGGEQIGEQMQEEENEEEEGDHGDHGDHTDHVDRGNHHVEGNFQEEFQRVLAQRTAYVQSGAQRVPDFLVRSELQIETQKISDIIGKFQHVLIVYWQIEIESFKTQKYYYIGKLKCKHIMSMAKSST